MPIGRRAAGAGERAGMERARIGNRIVGGDAGIAAERAHRFERVFIHRPGGSRKRGEHEHRAH